MGLARELRTKMLRAIRRPPLRWLARPAFTTLVDGAIRLERARDARREAPREDLADVTALVKTFERPAALRRLLRSLGESHPELAVIVVDDSRKPSEIDLPRVRVLPLPYDVGVAAGRNHGLGEVRTDLVLILDDDFVLTRRSGLARAATLMRRHPEIDIMGGQIYNLPIYERGLPPWNRDCYGGSPGAPIGGLERYDRVTNFFLGRTARIREIGWDPELKRVEHSDFFVRAHGVLCTVFNPELRGLHAMTPFDDAYMRKREDVARDLERLRWKWAARRE